MTPTHLDSIKFSGHALNKIEQVGTSRQFVYGRVNHLHGDCYYDKKKSCYVLHLLDKALAIAFSVYVTRREKTAKVHTVYPVRYSKFNSDRFELWEG